jgi:hypothetical protein
MANKGQFGKGKNAKKEGHKDGMSSGGNTDNLNNVGDTNPTDETSI